MILNTKMKNNLPQWHDYDMGNGVIAFSTTRKGGCSEGNYAAFNINRYCGDDPAHIEATAQRSANALASVWRNS